MSRNEDYLDNLLTSVTDKLNEFDDDFEQNRESLKQSYQTQNDLPQKTQSALDEVREDNFLKEFEKDLQAGELEDDLIREFEQELADDTDGAYDLPRSDPQTDQMAQMDQILDNIENIEPVEGNDEEGIPLEVDPAASADVDMALEQIFNDSPDVGSPDPSTSILEDTVPDPDPSTSILENTVPGPDIDDDLIAQLERGPEATVAVPKGMESLEDIFADSQSDLAPQPAAAQPEGQPDLDASLEQILNESDDDALAQLGMMFDTGEEGTQQQKPKRQPIEGDDPFTSEPDFSFDEAAVATDAMDGEGSRKKKRRREKDPNSLFSKITRVLFGSAEELNPELAAQIAAEKAKRGDADPENMDPAALKEKKKQEKALKKQQKKEAAEQKKQEKAAAKADKDAKKASKPKKEKKPKEKKQLPKEPPLPKVPVMMMWGIALSIMVLVFLGSSLIGYSSPVRQSKEAFDNGDYVTAYTKLQGIEVKEADEDLYHAAIALAGIQTELDAYTALMEQKQYEMALDALIRGLGRCDVHSAEAEEWGVSSQLEDLQKQFGTLLRDQFDVSKRHARKLYNIKKRSDYTMELHQILEDLGLDW